MAEKAVWDKTTVKHFCDICRDEVLAGHRPLGHFNKVGWKNLEVKFAEKTGQKLEHLQLKNKWDNLKRSYTCFMELKHAATGLGWDDARKTVECDEAWWKEHLQRCHDPANGRKCKHVQFKKRGPDNLEAMEIMFESAHVNGSTASIPAVLSDSSDDETVVAEEKAEDIGELKLASLKKKKDKKRKAANAIAEEKEARSQFLKQFKGTCGKIESAADKIASSFEASSTASQKSHVPSMAEAFEMVKECGVKEGTDIMHTATFLIMKPEFREVFSLMQTNNGRLHLLQKEHEKETRKMA